MLASPSLPLKLQSGYQDHSYEQETVYLNQRRWRGFMLLVTLLVGVRALFRHLDATFPKYFIRRHGPFAPFGMVYSLEPLLIIILVPLVSVDDGGGCNQNMDNTTTGDVRKCAWWRVVRYIRRLPSLSAITLGCYIGTMAPFVLVVSSSEWASVAFVCTIAFGKPQIVV